MRNNLIRKRISSAYIFIPPLVNCLMEKWHAIGAIQPSMDATKDFFSGPNIWHRWIKIALIVILAGYAMGAGFGFNSGSNWSSSDSGSYSGQSQTGSSASSAASVAQLSQQIQQAMPVIVFIAALLIFLGLIASFIHSVYIFMLFESVVRKEPKILGYTGKFIGKGFSLFIFRTLMGLLSLIAFACLILSIAFLLFHSQLSSNVSVQGFLGTGVVSLFSNSLTSLLVLVLSVVLIITFGIIEWFLENAAIYLMYEKDEGLKKAFDELLPRISSDFLQFLLLLVIRMVIGLAMAITSLLIMIPVAILGLIFGIPLLIAFFAALNIPALLALVVILGIIVLFGLWLLYAVLEAPFAVFLVNYHLNFIRLLTGRKIPSLPKK